MLTKTDNTNRVTAIFIYPLFPLSFISSPHLYFYFSYLPPEIKFPSNLAQPELHWTFGAYPKKFWLKNSLYIDVKKYKVRCRPNRL